MKRFVLPALLATSFLTLAACQTTSSLTETEQAPVVETETAFDGGMKQIDAEQSVISFTGKSDIVNHEGKFTAYTADVTLDETEPANLEKASVSVTVDLTSAVTDSQGLDGHLKKADFFDVETHPQATFTSTQIVGKGDNMYDITGDLTVKGQTKQITTTAEITDDYLTAQFDFPRQEYGVGNDSYGAKLLDANVPVNVKLVFVK